VPKLALFLSVAALGLAGFAAWTSRESPCEIRALRSELDLVAGLETRVAALEAARAKAPATAPPELARTDALAPAPGVARSGGADAGTVEKVGLARVASDLESRIAALEEKSKTDAHEGANVPAFRMGRMPRLPGGGKLYGSTEDASEDLSLTDQQKGDFERILADARREMEELQKIPNDEGKTYEQVKNDLVAGLANGSMKFDVSKLMAFRGSTIPGRGETYGQAENRIKAAAKSRMRDTLTRDQQSKFDKAQIDPMLGGGFGTTIVTSVTADDVKPAGR